MLARANGMNVEVFAEGAYAAVGDIVHALKPTSVAIVADREVARLHGVPRAAPVLMIDGGEQVKQIDAWRRVLDHCVACGLERGGVLVAIGGGTVLDVVGFAAATYLRGVRWVAVPTTLLAQVDAAFGGKTGLDHTTAKNLIGAFWQPARIAVDTALLKTLPEREVQGGWAEVVKHAVIAGGDLLERCGAVDPASIVEEAARIKLDIVARDPREADERRLLNLGHTLGHAIERAVDYELHHGEAVALGLRAACVIAELHADFADRERIDAALTRCGLPAHTAVDPAKVREALRHDKKRRDRRLRWVLPVALGDVRVFDDVPDAFVKQALAAVSK